MRVFISVDLDQPARREIEKLLEILEKKHWKVKWEKPEKLHITLAFLGEIDQSQTSKLKSQIQSLNVKPFVISFKGLGCFPDYEWPRIIWLGLKGDLKSLAALQKNVQEKLVQSGFKPDIKPFIPHITIGRIKQARAGERHEIARQIRALAKMEFKGEWRVDRVVIYESQTLPEGSVYKKLVEIELPLDKRKF